MPTTIVLYIEYKATPRYLRSKGKIVQVQIDSAKRLPRHTDPDRAYRWLSEHGYEPIPKEFKLLDRVGFRHRRKQVYRKQ